MVFNFYESFNLLLLFFVCTQKFSSYVLLPPIHFFKNKCMVVKVSFEDIKIFIPLKFLVALIAHGLLNVLL